MAHMMWLSHVVNQYNVVLMLQLLCILTENMVLIVAHDICEVGREKDGDTVWRWVLSYKDPCLCTKVRFGGLQMETPDRLFHPVNVDNPLVGDDVDRIREHYGIDCIKPELHTCPEDEEMETDRDKATARVVYQTPYATDDSGNVNVVCNPTSQSDFVIGITTVTCIARDRSGNSATCDFRIEIKDNEAPEFDFCPSNALERNTDPAMINPTAHDNSGQVPEVTCSFYSGANGDMGTMTVICKAVDKSGNMKNCHFNINVSGTGNLPDAPMMTSCPADETIQTEPGEATVMFVYQTPDAIDNLSEVSVVCWPSSGSHFAIGKTLVLCVARSSNGSTDVCEFTVDIIDDESPEFDDCPSTPLDTNTDPGQSTVMTESFYLIAHDNSGEVPTVTCDSESGTNFGIGETTVNCVAVDSSGNSNYCQFELNVLDVEAPVLSSCPVDQQISTDPGQATAVVVYETPTATDNSHEAINVACDPPSGDALRIGQTSVSCVAKDSSRNSKSCIFLVDIIDGEVPSISSCPADKELDTDPDRAIAVVIYQAPTATDNSGVVNVACNPPSGSEFIIGKTTVSCVARDSSENSETCGFHVEVRDIEPPVITSCADQEIGTDPGQDTATVTYQTTATDNSGQVSIDCNPQVGSRIPIGQIRVACVAQDNSGNSATCEFELDINDNEAPEFISCPSSPVEINAETGHSTAMYSWESTIAHDNSGEVPTITCDYESGTRFAIGETLVGCEAVDNSGNRNDCHFKVIVLDMEAPVMSPCPEAIVRYTDIGQATVVIEYQRPSATDNSGEAIHVRCYPLSRSPFTIGRTNVTCRAHDSSGNRAACHFEVDIRDNIKPVITSCPPSDQDIVLVTSPEKTTATVTYQTPTATDNSGQVTIQCTPSSNSEFTPGPTSVTCQARDNSGNNEQCTFQINIQASCENGWNLFGYYCYRIDNKVNTFFYSEYICQDFGGHLASIHSNDEQEFIEGTSSTGSISLPYWIGFTSNLNDGQFEWSDNSQGYHTNWAADEPSGERWPNCVAVDSGGGWMDRKCGFEYAWVCKNESIITDITIAV